MNILVLYKTLRYRTPKHCCLRLLHLEALKKKREGCDIVQSGKSISLSVNTHTSAYANSVLM